MRALAVALLLLPSVYARADETPEAQASRHFETGQKAFNDGEYATAIEEFSTAYRLVPHPDVLLDIAVSHERMYQPDRAREKYEQFLKDAPDSSEEATKRALAQNRLRVLRSLPGKILVASKPEASVHLVGEGQDRSGLTPKTFDGLPPGNYKVHVELGYHAPQDLEVTLAPGGQNVVNVQLEHQVETLTIFTRPDNARVFIDDREEGVTPFSRPIGVGKKRRLRVEAEDFPAWTEEIDVLPGQPVRRDIVFRRPTRSGRSELVLASMLYGGGGSVFITEAAMGCTDSNHPCGLAPGIRLGLDLGATVVGVGLGFLVSTLTTDDHVKVGHSSIIIGGTVWGTTLAAGLALGLNLDTQDVLAIALLGSALGIGAGFLTARINDTSPGDAAIVNSGGTWGSLTGVLMATAIDVGSDKQSQALGWLTLSGCALGLVAGSFLAWNIEISRGHVAVVDVAGLAGLALAFAVGYGVSPTTSSKDTTDHLRLVNGSRYGLGGMVVGLLAGAILSRKYKDDLPPTEALFTHHGRWAFGLPQIQVAPAPDGRDTRLTFELARGEF